MNEPSRHHLQAIEREFAREFPPDVSLGFDGTINDLANSMAAHDDYKGERVLMPLDSGEIARAGGVRWECYQAQRDDFKSAIARAQKAEGERDNARRKLTVARWIICVLWAICAALIGRMTL